MRIPDDLLESFCRRWWTPVYRFAFNMLGNASQAAVVTEETVFVLLQPDEPPAAAARVYRLALQFSLLRRRWTPQAVDRGPLRKQLQQLPHLDRAALLLRDVEDLPVEDVAAVLQISTAEARACAHRGRMRLMEIPEAVSRTG